MDTLLQIKTSLFGDAGQSSRLSDRFVGRWRASRPDSRLVVRDLAEQPVPHLTAERFRGFFLDPAERSPEQAVAAREADSLIEELVTADAVVLGLPMYNFSLPSTFKAWMDHVARAGTTFRYGANGPEGLAGDKPVYVFAARGGQYLGTDLDTQTKLVKTFFGFLGMPRVHFVYAEGLARSGDTPARSLATAEAEVDALAL